MRQLCTFVLLFLLACSTSMADQRERCPPAAFLAKSDTRLNTSDSLAFLNSIDQSNYSEAQHSLSATGMLPIEVPIQAQGSYSDFSKWWSEYKSRTAYYRTSDQDLTVVTSALNSDGLEAYKACLHGVYGLTIASKLNGTQLITELFWKSYPPPPGAKTIDVTVPVQITVTRGAAEEQVRQMDVGIDSVTPVVFALNKGEPFTAVFTVANNGGVSVSADLPLIHTCSITTPVSTVTYSKNPIVLDHQRNNGNVNATIAWGTPYFLAELAAKGLTNIEMQKPAVPEGGGAGNRWYRIYLSATTGGEKVYGPDPRCTRDEPPPT
ncbi:MAG: hypothetical protein ACREPQ_14220 [Rhodanobacter sp.]